MNLFSSKGIFTNFNLIKKRKTMNSKIITAVFCPCFRVVRSYATVKLLSIFITSIFIFTFIFLNSSNAQNDNPAYFSTVTPEKTETLVQEGWKGAYLDVAGMNVIDGVVLFSLLKKCGAEDFVLLQMINNNDYDVRVFWRDAVYTKERKLIDGETLSDSDEKSIIIKANSEVIGDCSKEHPQLIFNSKDFIDNPDNFNRYAPSSFDVTLE